MKVLVTGALGFIGYHLVKKLIDTNYTVIGIDNINSYYDERLKYAKLPLLGITETSIWPNVTYQSEIHANFQFAKVDITDRFNIEKLFSENKFEIVVNLAAQAGVQYSIANPHTYIENNVTGFINVLDACKTYGIHHFVYASSSSVYGDREDVPFKETDNVDHPISLYAASKKSNELMAYTYSHLYKMETTGLRFFTVYGPWGRPDMAPFIFVKRILEGETITVFNNGNMERDFTYVADIVEGISLVISKNIKREIYKIYNIGNSKPVNLNEFIHVIENTLGTKAKIEYMPTRAGDVIKTYSDISLLANDYGYSPKIDIIDGLKKFIDWYHIHYNTR